MPTAPKPGTLRNLRVKRVDLVDSGANFDPLTGDGAHIMLFKRDSVAKDGPLLGSVHVDAPSCTCSTCKARTKKESTLSKIATLVAKMAALFGETDIKKRDDAIAAIGVEAEEIDKAFPQPAAPAAPIAAAPAAPAAPRMDLNTLKAHYDTLCKMINSMAAPAGAPAAAPSAPVTAMKAARTELSKQLIAEGIEVTDDGVKAPTLEVKVDDQVSKRMVDLEKRATDAEAAVLVEKNLRLDREMVDIMKGFKHTPIDMVKDVAEFRKMKETHPAMFDRTLAIMKATEAQLAQSALYRNVGSGGGAGRGTAWEQIEAKADAMVEKATNGMTREQAIEKVMLANPRLVAEYRAEQQ